jgi:hypothetical protein
MLARALKGEDPAAPIKDRGGGHRRLQTRR